MIMILAVGRSGTTFLSKVLSYAKDVNVIHEPLEMLADDRLVYVGDFFNRGSSTRYIISNRMKFLKEQIKKTHPKKYIEVNGYLRRHIYLLKKINIPIDFIHIVRDPKKVIRSMMSRKQTILNKLKRNVKMPLFELCCRIWADENKILRENISTCFKLEDITTEWDQYKRLLQSMDIKQSKRSFDKFKDKRVNHTAKFTFPEFKNWSAKQKATFNAICRQEMNHYGYN